jgi:apolipoprotein N-acyltransferase
VILNWILALASAILLVLIFPGYSLTWAAPIALTPLLIAVARETRWRMRFALGYGAGFVFWFGLTPWIEWTLVQHGGVPVAGAWAVFALLCLAKALQLGLFAALAGPVMNRGRFGIPGIAALWVAIEWTQNYTGFEWLNLGNAGSDMSLLLRLAPVTGVWGISFAFALMSAVIAALVIRRQRFASAWLFLLLGLFLLPDLPAPERGDKSVVVVQPNIDNETVWSGDLQASTQQQLARLSLSLAGPKAPADMIVWPEMPAPFYADDPRFTDLTAFVAKTAQAGLLTGAIGRTPDRRLLNSALLTGPDGATISRYDKVNLVPFGEFVPWPFGAITDKISTGAGDYVPGTQAVVSAVGGHRIGTFICYESVYAAYVRRFTGGGAEALFNISNDSWYGKTAARYQHLQIVRMRAAENRRWIVRATNDGVSAVIDPAGRVVRTAPEFREATVRLHYAYRRDLTLYTRFGDWFVALCGLLTAGLLFPPKALR